MYWPPEGPGDRTADLFALGKTLYQLLTGAKLKHFPEFAVGNLKIPGDDPRAEPLRAIYADNAANVVSQYWRGWRGGTHYRYWRGGTRYYGSRYYGYYGAYPGYYGGYYPSYSYYPAYYGYSPGYYGYYTPGYYGYYNPGYSYSYYYWRR